MTKVKVVVMMNFKGLEVRLCNGVYLGTPGRSWQVNGQEPTATFSVRLAL